MTDIKFAKEHMGEYFQLNGYKVRVIGYDATGCGGNVIVDHPGGWSVFFADATDVINERMCHTGRCTYAKWEELRWL